MIVANTITNTGNNLINNFLYCFGRINIVSIFITMIIKINNNINLLNFTVMEEKVPTNEAAVVTAAAPVNQPSNKQDRKTVIPKGVPESTAKIAAFLNFNCDIRRHTAKNIIAAAKESGLVKQDSKCYVNFLWNKFQLKENGLNKEFLYTESFFIRSFAKSFEDIARDAGVVLENFFVDNDIHGEDVLGNTNNNG